MARHGRAAGTVEYPDTAYELPVVFGWDGAEVKTLSDLGPVLARAKAKLGGTGLEGALAAGDALMVSAEVIEALKYAENPRPYEGTDYCGFIPDRVLRSLGLALVDDTIPGVAVLLGQAADADALVKLVRDLQAKGLLIIAAGGVIEQLKGKGVRMGLDLMLYPVGHGTQVVHALNFAVRAALSFGAVQRGDRDRLQAFLTKRLKAFVLHFGPIDDITAGAAFAALLHGIPIVTDQNVEGVPDKLVSQPEPVPHAADRLRAQGHQGQGVQGGHPGGLRPRLRGRDGASPGHLHRGGRRGQDHGL